MAKEKTELQLKVEGLLKEKHLTKVGLANALDIPKQNVDRVFKVQKMAQMKVVAEYLGISLSNLLGDNPQIEKSHHVDGFVEIDGNVYRLKSEQDLRSLIDTIQ